MDDSSQQLLARARFASDQDGVVSARHLARRGQQLKHALRREDSIVAHGTKIGRPCRGPYPFFVTKCLQSPCALDDRFDVLYE